uniref:Uncharacterized protein n=1 Tax=Geobacter sp. (strain M21) TaxID=443144 RepID=C6E5I5_GEOSM
MEKLKLERFEVVIERFVFLRCPQICSLLRVLKVLEM